MINYEALKNWKFGTQVISYTARDTMLYALGIGMGADPMDEHELNFVFEKNLQAVPTMAAVLGTPGQWWKDPRAGIDWVKLVHGEQHVRLEKPFPAAATLSVTNRIVSVTDKGPGKGALFVAIRELRDQVNGELIATGRNVTFCRGDGGYSTSGGQSDPPPGALPAVPERDPDFEVVLPTLERQALLYRLSGDYNPLHADPAVGRAAGFERPILHGLCTYGMAAHALLKSDCRYDATAIRSLVVRFTAPVIPGETIRFQFWRSGAKQLQLRARVEQRNLVVMNNGVVELT